MQTLKNKIIESDNPVGVKKTSNWILPGKDFAYGKKDAADPEGVDISKYNIIYYLLNHFNLFSM